MSGVVVVSRCCIRSSNIVVDVSASYCSFPLLRLMSSIIYCGITSGVSGGAGGSAPSLSVVWCWTGFMLLCMNVGVSCLGWQSADDYLSGGKPCPGG